jgi:ABC-2 type transport system permease protein
MTSPAAALTLAGRGLRISRRQPDVLITALMLPVMLMLIFVYFFGGAIDTGTAYVTYVVPGAMLLCAGFGAASTAVSVADDMRNGVIDRFRSLDVGGVPILAGHVAASVIESLRALLLDQPAGNTPWTALAWCTGITALAITLAGTLFQRRTR